MEVSLLASIAADKYLLFDMSPNNCVVLLLHGNLENPAEYLKILPPFSQRSKFCIQNVSK